MKYWAEILLIIFTTNHDTLEVERWHYVSSNMKPAGEVEMEKAACDSMAAKIMEGAGKFKASSQIKAFCVLEEWGKP
ncbi:MAG: hypothetical protein QNJ62_06625 [Methyloceanibacter sp.]|nr:hypothetical protein [Methyloceanibacter sp.]